MLPRSNRADVSRYYDLIYLWTQLTNRFTAFRAPHAHTIHRLLVDPASGELSGETIHRLIRDRVKEFGPPEPLRALDAGCGYGGSCMTLSTMLDGSWHGITINRRQHALASRNAAALGHAARVSFSLASYDDPPSGGPYTLIYGIESLIHSADPAHTIANLAGALAPGGLFLIIDDMPTEAAANGDIDARAAADLAGFKARWRCPVMPSARQWSAHLEAAGLEVAGTHDLTPLSRPRSLEAIAAGIEEAEGRQRWLAPLRLGPVADAQIGGLMLERLTVSGAAGYLMIAAVKPPRSASSQRVRPKPD